MRFALLLLVALSLPLAAPANEPAAASEAGTRVAPVVTVVPAVRTEVHARVPVSGTIVARQEVQVYSEVAGHEIIEILVEAGDEVEQGQVLARLSTDTLSAQLEQARAEYLRAEAGVGQAQSNIDSAEAALTQVQAVLQRVRQLRQGGTASQSALDDAIAAEASARAQAASAANGLAVARASLAQAEAAQRIAQLNLDRATIKSPRAGLVIARTARLGAIAGSGSDPLFTILADGEVELSAEVIETALPKLEIGDTAEIRVAGRAPIPGRVRLVPAAVDPVTRLGIMRITLQADAGVRIGQFASGWVTTDRRQAITVPAGAVLADASGERVQVVRDGVVETRLVRAGLLWEGRREIVEGLALGEDVIARSGAFFRTGDQVRAMTAEETGP